ncbi:MAG TPA: hemerythrin domain-containing protein [Rubrivivax sp.]|nr:hemerythrin domain-containing protein [Rubrivivax sp.]
MIDVVDAWHREHVRFGRLLDLLQAQLAEFHDEGSPDYDLMRDIVHYLHDYADRYHHPREDLAFAAMLRHDAELKPMIFRLLQEHRVIGLSATKLLDLLDEVGSDALVSRAALEATAATFLAYYRCHLDSEERDILPRAARLLPPADWRKISDALPAGPDPLFDAQIKQRYRALSQILGR